MTPTAVLRAPDAPAAPRVADGHLSPSVSWTTPENNGLPITDYDVRYCEDSCGSWTDASFSGTGLTTTITGLTNGTRYEVQLRATNDVVTGARSASGTGTPVAQPPRPPTALVVSANSGELSLQWAPSVANGSPVTGYEVGWRTGNQAYSTDNVTISGTSATITGLTNGVRYEVRVRALSDVGTSRNSMIQGTPEAVAVTDHITPILSVSVTGEGNLGHTGVQGAFTSKGGAALSSRPVTGSVGTFSLKEA